MGAKSFEDLPLVLTVEETAKVLGIGRTLAYEAVRSGDLPSMRIGRRIVVPRDALKSALTVPASTR